MNAPLSHVHLRTPWQALLDGPTGDSAAGFHAAWMECLVAGIAGSSGAEVAEAVLVLAEDARATSFRPAAFWPAGRPCGVTLAALCEEALAMRMPMNRGQSAQALLAVPLVLGERLRGVVGVLFKAASVPRGVQDWLRWGSGWLNDAAADRDDGAALRERLLVALDLTMAVLGEANAKAAANAFVTEAAVRLGCDRVSLGYGRGRAVRLAALSHSADFSRRLDLARAIEAAMNEASDQATALCVRDGVLVDGHDPLPRGTAGRPADAATPAVDAVVPLAVIRDHEALTRGFGTRLVLSVPFQADRRRHGVVTFEWAQPDVDDAHLQVALGLPPVVGRMLLDKRHAQRAWPVRAIDALRTGAGHLLGPRHALVKLGVLALVVLGAWLAQATGDHRVSAQAALEGGVRRVVAAPFDGFIASAEVRAGQIVRKGDLLARMDDRDLRLEADRWRSQQSQYARQAQDAQAQRNLAQIQIALAQARQAAAQQRLSESQISRMRVEAPFDGVVVLGDLSQSLGAAVRKGQTLFEIAPLDSYRIILQVDETDIAHVGTGQKGQLMVTAMPGQTFPFTVKLVTPVANASEGRNLFRVEATLDERTDHLRPGMEGIGKIEITERKLLWIWTHHAVDWLRLQLWNWFGVSA